MIGVYKILHKPTGKYYIGSSSNIRRRFNEHRYKLTHRGKFDCGWVIDDKNIGNYEFSILTECTLDELHYKEVEYINAADPVLCQNVRADDEKCHRCPNVMSGKHWYTNGIDTVACYDDDAPEGWWRGRSNGMDGIKNAPRNHNVKGTPAYEKFRLTKMKYSNYIDTRCMDIQILSNGEFVPLNGILVNSAGASNQLCEVMYDYKGISTRSLALTTDHPLVTGRGRVKVEDLVPGDIIYDSVDKTEHVVKNIVPIESKSTTYDVETDNDVFDLSGILSHNCRTRVIGNINGPQQTTGRGNFAFHTLNLPRLAIEAHITESDIEKRKALFFEKLDGMLNDAKESLLERFRLICKKTYEKFPFTMQEGLYLTSDDEKHEVTDTIAEVMKQSTLSIGYVGLAETVKVLTGKTYGIDHEVDEFAVSIIKHMRDFTDAVQRETHFNWSTFATPAEAVAGRFANIDKNRFATEVTDEEGKKTLVAKDKRLADVDLHRLFGKGYYTNSHMMDFSLETTLENKIAVEAPFHKLTNAGHIFYFKVNGDPSKNPAAVKKCIDAMYDGDLGYYTVSYNQDTCLKCGFHGIIDNVCPKCGCADEDMFARLRRVTGYLVGAPKKSYKKALCDGKLAEMPDRVNI